jgi:hypothetical protein
MRKALLSSLLLVMLLLSACGSKTTATPVTPTTAPTAATAATPAGAKPGECQLAPSPIFVAQPASAAVYAPISTSDHIEGSDTAVMTLIEYSDFT